MPPTTVSKFLQDRSWDWSEHNLELLSPIPALSAGTKPKDEAKATPPC